MKLYIVTFVNHVNAKASFTIKAIDLDHARIVAGKIVGKYKSLIIQEKFIKPINIYN